MNDVGLHPLETILRSCAAAAPQAWYPRLYAKQADVDPHELGRCLEELWLSGLIERRAGTPETGPAVTLTRTGERVLMDPQALERLRTGRPVSTEDRGAVLRQALRGQLRPFVTRLLVALNIFVFGVGYYYAKQQGLDRAFLQGSSAALPVLERCGALEPIHLLRGEWWRLLTAGFVHIGLLHILMNMACLYFAGRFIEQMWGRLRYLLIYVTALLGGSILAIVHAEQPNMLLAGASGAVCGVLAAEAVWFFLNRRYLPRALLRQERNNVLINLVLLVFISCFANVSGWGHFGGAAAGALAALLLQLHRFGPPRWRWLAIAGFAPLIWYGHYSIEQARYTNVSWKKAQDGDFKDRLYPWIRFAMRKAIKQYAEEVKPVVETHPTRRDPGKVDAALAILGEQQQELNSLAEQLQHAGPYGSEALEEARQVGHQYVSSMVELLSEAERVLRLGDKRTSKDRRSVQEQEEKVMQMRQAWNDFE